MADGFINIFESNTATKDQVDTHCDMVWSNCAHANADKLSVRGVTKPGDNAALNVIRNGLKLKHAMMDHLFGTV